MNGSQIYQDGRWRSTGDCASSPLAHALHYGTGVFEGIRAYATPEGPRIFRLGAHLERMRQGAALLGIALDTDEVATACTEALSRNDCGDAYLRPIAYLTDSRLDLDVLGKGWSLTVAALPWTSPLGEIASHWGVRMTVSPLRRNAAAAIPPLKLTGGYVNSVLAKREAAARGFAEALFEDERGFVCEATAENVFAVFGREVVAVEHADALPGITRDALLELSAGTLRPVSLAELQTADEIFLTGTATGVTPVAALDERIFPVGATTRRLQAEYARLNHTEGEALTGRQVGRRRDTNLRSDPISPLSPLRSSPSNRSYPVPLALE